MSHQSTTITTTVVHPTQPFQLDTSLSLIPRLRLNLTIHRADKSVSPLDEWKLKNSLIDYLTKTHSITLSEQHIKLHNFKDINKRKREEPVAKGSLFILDFEPFLIGIKNLGLEGDELEKRLLEWKKGIHNGMDGMEVNLEGVRFKLSVVLPVSDDVVEMKKQWEEIEAFGNNKGYSRGERKQHDTIILKGLPSRWFAETRVSSKPSMLVSHTIFSALGNIRNLDVAEDNDIDDEVEDGGGLVSGLNCKIVVRFKTHADFLNALKLLCGRSLMKEGSRLRADYEVTWDKDGFFQNSRSQVEERKKWAPSTREGKYRSEPYSRALNSDDSRRRRFKD